MTKQADKRRKQVTESLEDARKLAHDNKSHGGLDEVDRRRNERKRENAEEVNADTVARLKAAHEGLVDALKRDEAH